MNFALVAVGSCAALCAILMVFQGNLYAGALCLMAVLLQVSALFFLFGAQLLALMQALIYAGAIMVLIVLAVMAAPPRLSKRWADFKLPRSLVAVVVALPFAELIWLAWARMGGRGVAAAAARSFDRISATSGMEREMAGLLFGRYALMTEAIGMIVLISALAMLQER